MTLSNKLVKNCIVCGKEFEKNQWTGLPEWFGCPRRPFGVRYCSISCAKKGKPPWNKGKKGLQIAWNKGKSNTWMLREKNPNWRGGVERRMEFRKIRRSIENDIWRCSVLVRDKFICQLCSKYPANTADHIKSFANFPELRFAISNGQTVCKSCHRKLPTSGGSNVLRDKTL